MSGKNLTVFDPAMCCSTGVCGPEVDPKLVRFSADLDWVKSQGVEVRRFNLAQEPGAFVGDEAIQKILAEEGNSALPVVKVGADVVSKGTYPSRESLAQWAGLDLIEAPQEAKSGGCCGPSTKTEEKSSCC